METVTRSQIKHMKPEERLRHYEQEKSELFYQLSGMSAEEVREAYEALREKWQV